MLAVDCGGGIDYAGWHSNLSFTVPLPFKALEPFEVRITEIIYVAAPLPCVDCTDCDQTDATDVTDGGGDEVVI